MPAQTPIWSYVGQIAMTRVEIAIIEIDNSMTVRRPTRSATTPNTTPPSGRTANPTANTARALSVGGHRVAGGEELRADERGEQTEDLPVVPLQRVAQAEPVHRLSGRLRVLGVCCGMPPRRRSCEGAFQGPDSGGQILLPRGERRRGA